MRVKVETEGPCRRVVHIDAPPEEVLPEYGDIVKRYARQARVKGFRPGRAPVAHVERIYAKSIEDDVKDRMLPRLYREAVQREALAEVGPVDVRDVVFHKANGLSFKVVVDVAPDFKLPKYAKMTLKANPVDVSDAQVADAMKSIMESHARYEDADEGRPVQQGDLVNIDYGGSIEETPVKTLVPDYPGLAEGKDFWTLIDDPEFLPGFNVGLIGCAVNEERAVSVTFPADYRVPALAGKTAAYTVTVMKIRDRILPALDEAFLKRFDAASEEDLRAKIRADLLARAEQTERQRLKDDMAKQLLEKTRLDLPQSQVEAETRRAAQTMVRQIAQQGGGADILEKQKDRIMAAAYRSSAERVKLSYILERIAAEENIAVADDAVDREMQAMARQYGMAPAKLREELEKNDGVKRLAREMLCDKTLDFLLENAKIKN